MPDRTLKKAIGIAALFLCGGLWSVPVVLSQPLAESVPDPQKGISALNKKDVASAARFKSVSETDPQNQSAALYHIGYARYLRGEFHEAMEAFRRAYSQSPEYSPLTLREDAPHLIFVADADESPGPLPEPPPDVAQNPDFQKGKSLLTKGRYSRAVKEFEAALEESPLQAGYHYYKGYSLYTHYNYIFGFLNSNFHDLEIFLNLKILKIALLFLRFCSIEKYQSHAN